jgi:hypothetical protein
MAELKLDAAELRPLVQAIVAEVLSEMGNMRLLVNGQLAVDEAEAAGLLDLNSWQLRDLRLAGKIGYSRIVGDRVRYTADDLLDYLSRCHVKPQLDSHKSNGRR